MKKYLIGLAVLLLAILVVVLVACSRSEPTTTSTPLPVRPTATTELASSSRATATTITNNSANSRPTATATTAAVTNRTPTVAVAEDDLTAVKPERTIIRTFTDAQGRTVRLLYGRGNGHSGDYGWAHILGKHINGIWYDGGTITTFPKAVNAKTPAEVITLIGKSLQDQKPDDEGGGRRSYVYAVPGTNKDVFTVVGSDGTLITSYPVNHGSKDEDS
jgi:hypothetical protein